MVMMTCTYVVMIVRTSPGKCDCGGGAVEGARQAGVLEGEILVDAGTGTVDYRYKVPVVWMSTGRNNALLRKTHTLGLYSFILLIELLEIQVLIVE